MYGEDGKETSSIKPGDPKPKYWNNVPKSDNDDFSSITGGANPFQEMNLMRKEQKAHQVQS